VTAHGKKERQINFHSMLPSEAKNQQAQIRKLTPQHFPKATHAVLVLEAQRKIEGLAALLGESRSNAGLGIFDKDNN
jgi:predicted outer membrane protein